MFADNASSRLKLYMKAFCAEDKQSSQSLISQAKSLSTTGSKILQGIKSKQESIQWERMPIKYFHPYCMNPGDRFQKLETMLRGMEMALTTSTFPITTTLGTSEEFKNGLGVVEESISHHLKQIRTGFNGDLVTVPESGSSPKHSNTGFLQTLQTTSKQDLPSLFFLFCLNLLYTESKTIQGGIGQGGWVFLQGIGFDQLASCTEQQTQGNCSPEMITFSWISSLFWAFLQQGKPVLGWSPGGDKSRCRKSGDIQSSECDAQGTVIGTVYGVMGCFVFERFLQVRFIALLPWFLFTSFLQRSKMYSQAGSCMKDTCGNFYHGKKRGWLPDGL